MLGRSVFLRGQPRLIEGVGGAGPVSRGFLAAPTCAHNMRTKFCMVIKLDMRKKLQGRPRMLTRDLFAVAKLLGYYYY